MARYTQHFLVEIAPENLHSTIIKTLESCSLVITYETDDYVIAQEIETNAAFAKMVTVEVLIHRSEIEGNQAKLTSVTKNAELPCGLIITVMGSPIVFLKHSVTVQNGRY